MLEFLNAYSGIIVAVILGIFTVFQSKKEKREKEKRESLIEEIRKDNATNDEVRKMEKEARDRKDEELSEKISGFADSITSLESAVTKTHDEVRNLKTDLSDFKTETKNKFSIISENGLQTMRYTRGIASVTLDLIKSLDSGTCKNPISFNRFLDLCDNQDEILLDSMYRETKK